MTTSVSALLGVLFLVLAIITSYLMFQFWGYPFDKEKGRSECPQWKMNIHRGFGYAYVLVYVIMMSQMLPRLWTYQVEIPARTVAHMCFGVTIGVVLLVKISILRWFRHLEEWMPALGMILLLCTFLLSGLSLPFVLKERNLASDHAFSVETHERLVQILPTSGLAEDQESLEALASESSLRHGREVLLNKCTHCHDLKTAIARPRTPSDWFRVVERMASKPALGQTIESLEQRQVTAYLIAITSDLQKSAKASRAATEALVQARESLAEASPAEEVAAQDGAGSPTAAQLEAAKLAFETKCSQCHSLGDIEDFPPETPEEVQAVLTRMVENGLEADSSELELIRGHLIRTFGE